MASTVKRIEVRLKDISFAAKIVSLHPTKQKRVLPKQVQVHKKCETEIKEINVHANAKCKSAEVEEKLLVDPTLVNPKLSGPRRINWCPKCEQIVKRVGSQKVHKKCGTPVEQKVLCEEDHLLLPLSEILWCPECNNLANEMESQPFCSSCQTKVEAGELIAGYKIGKECIGVSKEEEEGVESFLPDPDKLEIRQILWERTINPIYFNEVYGLEPEKGGVKWLTWLRTVLEKKKAVAWGEVIVRNPYRAILKPYKGRLLLITLFDHDEVASLAVHEAEVEPETIAIGEEWIKKNARNFDPKNHCRDLYRETLERWVEAKKFKKKVKFISLLPTSAPPPVSLPEEMATFLADLEEKPKEEKPKKPSKATKTKRRKRKIAS